MLSRQIFLALLLLSQPAAANKLLKCNFVSGAFLQDCAINPVPLDERKFPYLMEMKVNYRYECKTDFYLALEGGSSKVDMPPRLNDALPEVRSFTVQGFGPFRIYDTDPSWTSLTAASEPCLLALDSHSLELASSTMREFDNHVDQYEKLAKAFAMVQNSVKTAGLIRNLIDKADLGTLQTFWETLRMQIQSAKDASVSPELTQSLENVLATMEYGTAENPSLEEGQELQKKLKNQLDAFDGMVVDLGEEINTLANPHYLEAYKIASYGKAQQFSEALKKLESSRIIFSRKS